MNVSDVVPVSRRRLRFIREKALSAAHALAKSINHEEHEAHEGKPDK